jgi:hypothetical protein
MYAGSSVYGGATPFSATAAGTTYPSERSAGSPFGTGLQSAAGRTRCRRATRRRATDMWGSTRSTTRASRSRRRACGRSANMDFDLTDDAGNVQQQLAQISKDVILWGEPGDRGVGGRAPRPGARRRVPAGHDGPQGVISEGIRPLYRSYVAAGHRPGSRRCTAATTSCRSLDGNGAVVDTLGVPAGSARLAREHAAGVDALVGGYAGASAWAQRARVDGRGAEAAGGVPAIGCATTDAFTPAAANKQDGGRVDVQSWT